jgi:hypothetical protein
MLREAEMRVLDVAVACGFKTQQHFARVFRQICGASYDVPIRGSALKASGHVSLLILRKRVRSCSTSSLDGIAISTPVSPAEVGEAIVQLPAVHASFRSSVRFDR